MHRSSTRSWPASPVKFFDLGLRTEVYFCGVVLKAGLVSGTMGYRDALVIDSIDSVRIHSIRCQSHRGRFHPGPE